MLLLLFILHFETSVHSYLVNFLRSLFDILQVVRFRSIEKPKDDEFCLEL